MTEPRHFLSLGQLSGEELGDLLDAADAAKATPRSLASKLKNKQVALIFEKPSTRTRVSFEAAVNALGGEAIALRGDELQLGRGETLQDTARVLSRYVDALVVRTYGQERLEQLAEGASVPVINALSDYSHPCQGLADLQTIRESKGTLEGVALGYLGDGNNVAHSLMFGGALAGMHVRIASPAAHSPSPEVARRAELTAAQSGGSVVVTEVVAEAASGADVLYTDVWASMGQEGTSEARAEALERYRLDSAAVELAADDVIVMHCLPAHRGEEIEVEVMDGPHSVVWDQAENRLHTQKALLAWLLGG
ncbi:ornithine carbamoyltransferase [soil metagenome]